MTIYDNYHKYAWWHVFTNTPMATSVISHRQWTADLVCRMTQLIQFFLMTSLANHALISLWVDNSGRGIQLDAHF